VANWGLRNLTPQRRRAAIVAVAALAFFAKVMLALETYGTNDVYAYERFGLWSRYLGVDLYNIAPDMNHPPSILHFLSALLRLADFTHLPFQFWLRFCGSVADVGSLWLVCRILGERLAERSIFFAVLLLAVSPIDILISGFHGNTDPIMIFFVLLAAWLAGYCDRAVWGGAAFGLAFCIKIAPVIAAPALLLSLPGLRKRAQFLGAAAAVMLGGWSPYIFQDAGAVARQVFGYKSSYGLWGFSWLLRQLAVAWPASWRLNLVYDDSGSALVIIVIAMLAIAMSRGPRRPSLYAQLGMAFLIFFSFTSGFAVQYLAWLTPWIAELGAGPVAVFMAAGSVFLLVVYNYWALGMPWYLAIAYPWNTHQYFQALCWLSVIALAVIAWMRIRREGDFVPWHSWRIPRAAAWSGAAAAAAALLIYPAIVHLRRDRLDVAPVYAEDTALYTEAGLYQDLALELSRRGRRAEAKTIDKHAVALEIRGETIAKELARAQPARLALKTPEMLVNTSLDDYERGHFAQCAYHASESLKLRAGMSAALNNLVLCNGRMGNWERAVKAAEEGVRLEPEAPEARRNLEWALGHGRRAQ
jgi:hypothetical protein